MAGPSRFPKAPSGPGADRDHLRYLHPVPAHLRGSPGARPAHRARGALRPQAGGPADASIRAGWSARPPAVAQRPAGGRARPRSGPAQLRPHRRGPTVGGRCHPVRHRGGLALSGRGGSWTRSVTPETEGDRLARHRFLSRSGRIFPCSTRVLLSRPAPSRRGRRRHLGG